MHPKYEQTAAQVLDWARTEVSIQGVLVIGSQARCLPPSDAWSDLDLMVLADDPLALVAANGWVERFGRVVCSFEEIVPLHFTDWQWRVKRVLYADERDVDFSILPYHRLEEVLRVNQEILARGFQVLFERSPGALESQIGALLKKQDAPAPHAPGAEEMRAVVSEILYHVIWALKKIRRGELWVAVRCINTHMSGLLLRLIEAHNSATGQPPDSLLYGGRFLEQRTDAAVLARLAGCFARYDAADAQTCLQNQFDLTETLWKTICDRTGAPFEAAAFERIQAVFDRMKAAG